MLMRRRSTAVGSNSFPPLKTSHCLLPSLISSNTFRLWKSINPACFTAFNWTCIRKSVEAPPGETLTMLTWRKTFIFHCVKTETLFFSETESSHKESGGGPVGGPGGAPFICSGANHSDSSGSGPVYCLDRLECHFNVRPFYYWLYCWNIKSHVTLEQFLKLLFIWYNLSVGKKERNKQPYKLGHLRLLPLLLLRLWM